MKKLGTERGGEYVDGIHFSFEGGQIRSLLSLISYFGKGENRERYLGVKIPPTNLQPDYRRAGSGVRDRVGGPSRRRRTDRVRALERRAERATDRLRQRRAHMSDETIDRTKLPIRRPPFSGVANQTLGGSEPGWEQIGHVKPPEGAPNVLVVLIDDAGFGNPGTFGGPIDTPNYDRIAAEGLRYNRFHVTAMCSPTRAALLTGRNHHAVGMGGIPEASGGFPGYSAMLPKDAAPFPKVLKENGYSTAAIGKWHLTPEKEQGPAGPFDHWPNGWGFDYYWGFLAPEASQFDTMIAENQKFIGVQEGKDGKPFYFPEAMTDQAIDWLHGVRGHDSEKPWCLYYSTGCSHAPHHVWKEWSEKYKGRFDQGWDKLREETFERQKKLGVVPADAILTPRDESMPAWDSLDENSKRAVRAPDGGLRGLFGERRPSRRPAAGLDRGDGRAR